MAVNFPDNPSNGDTTVVNGVTYTYNATNNLWKAGSSSSGGGGGGVTTYATVAELPLTNNTNGDMAFVEETDRLYLSNDNGWFNIALINTSPTITNGGTGSYVLATDGTPTVITLTATDPEEVPLTWSYTVTSGALGTTATVSQADNVFTITPGTTDPDDAGTFEITFSVTDGTNIVNDVNSFSLEFITTIADSSYTIALITTNGTTGTNTAFTDSSSNALTITPTGSPSLQTFSPYRDGGYSTYFDGSGDYLRDDIIADNLDNTGDNLSDSFTMELWVYDETPGETNSIIGSNSGATGANDFLLLNNGVEWLSSSQMTFSLTANTWHHLVVEYDRSSGNYLSCWLDGTRVNRVSVSGAMSFANNHFAFGTEADAGGFGTLGNYFQGYMHDVKISKEALYGDVTSITVPTSPTTPESSNVFSGFTKGYIANDFTVGGNITTKPFGPYDYNEYNSSNHGGSIYFDGSSYLQNGTAFGSIFDYSSSIPFTIDMWFYPTTSGTSLHIANMSNGTVDANLNWLFRQKTDNTLRFVMIDQSGTVVTCDSTDLMNINAWNHVAVVMTGSSIKHWLNGAFQQEVSFSGSKQVNGDVQIGQWANTFYQGYIADFRWNVGEQVYTGTADITPPTEPLSSTNATLHVKGTGANIIDKSQSTTFVINNGYADDGSYGGVGPKYAGTSFYNTNNNPNGGISFTLPEGLGTDDFTIEGWLKWMTNGSWDGCFFQIGDHTQSSGLILNLHNPNPVIRFGSSNTYVDNTTTIASNQWYHIAVTRESGVCKIWLDGQLEGTRTTPEDITATTGYILSATYNNSGIVGHVEDFRITKGLARYTANFTPPTGSLEG
jgi:hypothetical protein